MKQHQNFIENIYKELKDISKIYAGSNDILERLLKLHVNCIEALALCKQLDLISQVEGKKYFAFSYNNKISRAVNRNLFIMETNEIEKTINFISKEKLTETTPENITKALYTMAISFCSIIDLLKERDQKTPGTFFEIFACHWFSRMLQIHPKKEIDVLNLDKETKLPTDYIFDLGKNRPKIHLPIKTSTRERVIQVWAHQRVLDGVYGVGRFLGMCVCLSETKVDKKKLEVVEICLPEQWQVYQMFIAQMKRIYYLDVPNRYQVLNDVFPPINVRPYGDFFYEVQKIEQGNYVL
ncbi:hypothetical protein PAE9249_03207 [Paenibacillus sp. CECT 9249]|uniref:hypothetical protein n=1 Tax=Paenibacillus sp. CECT 9249 TaxID=2845385 RepID=UPI001E2FFDB8|nr:hypothetical protein [Paenibacillus sp. CECT 9249]CAH0120686.1 hypothetical protein PAE9249_03207 [Paenibacillus sp. CECT 9249]